MKAFVEYKNGDNEMSRDERENTLLEMMARCMIEPTYYRIILEKGKEKGDSYFMIDLSTGEEMFEGNTKVAITEGGEQWEYATNWNNYIDAVREIGRLMDEKGWTVIYTETF